MLLILVTDPAFSEPADSLALPVRKASGKKTDPVAQPVRPKRETAPEKQVRSDRSTGSGTSSESEIPTDKRTSKTGSSESQSKSATVPGSSELIQADRFNPDLIGQLVFDATNAERSKAGLPPFLPSEPLRLSATGHSADMARRDYFSHQKKGLFQRNRSLRERVSASGKPDGMVAENIAMLPTYTGQQLRTFSGPQGVTQTVETNYTSYAELAARALDEWMKSPGHRENILHRSLTHLGVGTALGTHNGVPYVYLTQNFSSE